MAKYRKYKKGNASVTLNEDVMLQFYQINPDVGARDLLELIDPSDKGSLPDVLEEKHGITNQPFKIVTNRHNREELHIMGNAYNLEELEQDFPSIDFRK